MSDTHHTRRVKLFKDSKIEKMVKYILCLNLETKRHICQYKQKYIEAQIRHQDFENFINQEVQKRNRERDGSSLNRNDREQSAGSRARASLNRDMTPNKIMKVSMLQTNSSLSASDSNILNLKNQVGNQSKESGRTIKTPQTTKQLTEVIPGSGSQS